MIKSKFAYDTIFILRLTLTIDQNNDLYLIQFHQVLKLDKMKNAT